MVLWSLGTVFGADWCVLSRFLWRSTNFLRKPLRNEVSVFFFESRSSGFCCEFNTKKHSKFAYKICVGCHVTGGWRWNYGTSVLFFFEAPVFGIVLANIWRVCSCFSLWLSILWRHAISFDVYALLLVFREVRLLIYVLSVPIFMFFSLPCRFPYCLT